MPISWTAALRLYGQKNGGFVVPKKGSAVYDAVKKLQNETADAPEHAVKKRVSKKAMAPAAAPEKMAVVAEAHEPQTKAKRAPTGKGGAANSWTRNSDPIVPPAAGTKNIEAAGGAGSRAQNIKDNKPVVEEAAKKPVMKRKVVMSSGLTAGAMTSEFLTNENTMGGGAASGQLPGQMKRLKETLEEQPGEVSIVTVGNGEERTIDGMRTDDKPGISGERPFSFQALRNRLLC